MSAIRQSDLEAYLDEALPAEEMARIEASLRSDPKLIDSLAVINSRRDSGVHSLGEIWRRHRLSCPTREQLGGHLLGSLDEELSEYVRFHLEQAGCRLCQANLKDLEQQQAEATETVVNRRRRYFQSSTGLLKQQRKG